MVCVDKTILYLSYYLLIKKVPNICKQFANNLLVDGKLLKKKDSKLSSQVNFLVNVLDDY